MSSQEKAEAEAEVAEAEAEDDPPIFLKGERGQHVLGNHAVLRRETKLKLLSFDF